ncbi:MAG: helix-turn-helix domain-containing protein [Lachnospiraceae bacterium]|nr:helix-turn-helix domain-containing protein [Lachnospiraceae bacterium]
MFYDAELSFLTSILKNYHIQTHLLTEDTAQKCNLDLGLRELLGKDIRLPLQQFIKEHIHPKTFYRISDSFHCKYVMFLLPQTEPPTTMVIGPYACMEITKEIIYQIIDEYHIPPDLFPQVEKYYSNIPIFIEDSLINTLLNTFGEKIWGGLDSFTIHSVSHFFDLTEPICEKMLVKNIEEPLLSIQVLENRYATENKLMQAVSQGQPNKAESIISSLSLLALEERTSDPLRNLKNYSIILNTLLRKAAETGSVHPLHIDKLSADFARKIELLTSKESVLKLQRDMIHKYCLLVKNHSMKSYSLLVQKVITQIDLDLTADLSLKTQAKLQNVNASYLSSLFKKETGMTLTEYVNKKRIDQAIFLLNSTSMQIQTIALYCGIPDVNYFTKTFKKYIGKTPREYRDNILFYKP